MTPDRRAWRDSLIITAGTVLAVMVAASPWLATTAGSVTASVLAAVALGGGAVLLRWRYSAARTFSAADRITLIRVGLAAVLAGQLVGDPTRPATGVALAAIALTALVLDGVDGWLARRRGEASDFGARLDMETDAIVILVLCALIWAAGRTGPWVLMIGALRYAFLLAQTPWPRLARPLPPSRRRRVVCAVQVGVLPLCLLPQPHPLLATLLAGTALALLCYSFAVDTQWLIRSGTSRQPGE